MVHNYAELIHLFFFFWIWPIVIGGPKFAELIACIPIEVFYCSIFPVKFESRILIEF